MTDRMMIPVPIVMPLGTACNAAGVQDVWDAFVKPHQDAEAAPSVEMRILVAILRAVYQGFADPEAVMADG